MSSHQQLAKRTALVSLELASCLFCGAPPATPVESGGLHGLGELAQALLLAEAPVTKQRAQSSPGLGGLLQAVVDRAVTGAAAVKAGTQDHELFLLLEVPPPRVLDVVAELTVGHELVAHELEALVTELESHLCGFVDEDPGLDFHRVEGLGQDPEVVSPAQDAAVLKLGRSPWQRLPLRPTWVVPAQAQELAHDPIPRLGVPDPPCRQPFSTLMSCSASIPAMLMVAMVPKFSRSQAPARKSGAP